MLVDDFYFDATTGLFTEAAETSYLGEVVVRLRSKQVSNEKNDRGIPVYPGDWFFDRSFGCNAYEVKTVTDENIRKTKHFSEAALQSMLSQKKLVSVSVKSQADTLDLRRINVAVEAVQADGSTIFFQYFNEVS